MVRLLYTIVAFLDDYRYEMWKGASPEPFKPILQAGSGPTCILFQLYLPLGC